MDPVFFIAAAYAVSATLLGMLCIGTWLAAVRARRRLGERHIP